MAHEIKVYDKKSQFSQRYVVHIFFGTLKFYLKVFFLNNKPVLIKSELIQKLQSKSQEKARWTFWTYDIL